MASAASADPQDRVSEIVPTATEAWAEHGFRVQLRFGLETFEVGPSPEAPLDHFSLAVEPGVRLGRWWSLSSSLRYTVLAEGAGLRWTTSADLTLHPYHGFHLSAGVGYAGMLGTLCEGGGLALLARTGWLIPLGEVFAMGPMAQWDSQATSCYSTRTEQVLRHRSMNLSWAFAWR